jgi:oligoribonuclease NrnB/cAMP/cGMP phosphodiesterase (DHH superfamily)
MKRLVIYHANCLDGFGAAFAAWLKFGYEDTEYLPMGYSDEIPDVKDREVYILDFSFKADIIKSMISESESLMVIDHHKTSQEDLKDFTDNCIFNMDKSGAVLAWEYFHGDKHIPLLLKHIEDRDLWLFKYEDTKAATAALFSVVERSFEAWKEGMYALNYTINGNLQYLPDIGGILERIHGEEVEILFKHRHLLTLTNGKGVEGLAVNCTPKYSSDLGNLLAKESGTFGCTYYYDGKKELWMYSLRSTGNFDVSLLAKAYGGGGHVSASGFSSRRQL